MIILHVAPIGHAAEGIGTVLKVLTVEQRKLGHDVIVVSKYVNTEYHDSDIVTIKEKKAFKDFVIERKPDIVVFHSIYEKEFISFSKVLLNLHIPYLVQMHGGLSYEHYKKNRLKKWIANSLVWNCFFKKASCILYLNQAEYDNCIVKTLNHQHAIIPNGCNVPKTSPNEEKVVDIVDVVFIGRIIITHKGLDVLISAIKKLKEKGVNNVRFSFYGNEIDPDVPIFKEMLDEVKDYAVFYGSIWGAEKVERLQKSDIFILTSRYEGMPMGILEALSYGIPCLVTPGTNMSDGV